MLNRAFAIAASLSMVGTSVFATAQPSLIDQFDGIIKFYDSALQENVEANEPYVAQEDLYEKVKTELPGLLAPSLDEVGNASYTAKKSALLRSIEKLPTAYQDQVLVGPAIELELISGEPQSKIVIRSLMQGLLINEPTPTLEEIEFGYEATLRELAEAGRKASEGTLTVSELTEILQTPTSSETDVASKIEEVSAEIEKTKVTIAELEAIEDKTPADVANIKIEKRKLERQLKTLADLEDKAETLAAEKADLVAKVSNATGIVTAQIKVVVDSDYQDLEGLEQAVEDVADVQSATEALNRVR